MSVARNVFCERLRAIRGAVGDFRLSDLPPSSANMSHNASVRIIRNGLAVQCFNVLEDFLKARMAELLTDVGSTVSSFQNLPQELRIASTLGVLKAVNFQSKFFDSNGKITTSQNYSAKVASTSTNQLQLAEYSFFHSSSNISLDQFNAAMKAFLIHNQWVQITGFASRARLLAMADGSLFKNLADRRHRAAHDANATVSEVDLLQSVTDAFALAIGFDAAMSKAAKVISRLRNPPADTFYALSDHNLIPVRLIKPHGRGFAEVKEVATRSTRLSSDFLSLIPGAQTRSSNENGVLFVFDANGIFSWYA